MGLSLNHAVIDPVSCPEDHKNPPLEIYVCKEGCRLEAAIATTILPRLGNCEFIVQNAINPFRRVFASKSILHELSPGGSKYSNAGNPFNGNERALNTFAIKIEQLEDTS